MEGIQPEKIEVIKHNSTHRPMHQRKSIKYSPSARVTSMQRPSFAKSSIIQQKNSNCEDEYPHQFGFPAKGTERFQCHKRDHFLSICRKKKLKNEQHLKQSQSQHLVKFLECFGYKRMSMK